MLDQDPIKVCPECGGEFRPDFERCADCEVALVHPEEIVRRDAKELPVSQGLAAVCTEPIAVVRALAAELERLGLRYRIDRRRAREGLLTVYVRWQDQKAAKEIAADFIASEPAVDVPAERGRRQEASSYKVCLDCGGEYRLDVERCADCGTVLALAGELLDEEDEEEEEEGAEPDLLDVLPYAGPANELPPSDDLVCICCRPIETLHRLSYLLNEAGIAHRIDPPPYSGPRLSGCLYTLSVDGDAAAAVDDGMWSKVVEGSDLETELSVCPACETRHPPGARECTSCGLVLGSADGLLDRTCRRCGAVVGLPVERCPNCDVTLPPS